MPKILHVNSYYITNKLQGELVYKLDEQGCQQFVFVPVSRDYERGINDVNNLKNTVIYYKKAFNTISRLIWPVKMWLIYKTFKQVVLSSFNTEIIHSHSLIVNEITAFKYYKKTKTPYVVTVRNTDINIFLSKSFIFRRIGENILNNASAVQFLSPAYRDIQLKKIFLLIRLKLSYLKHTLFQTGLMNFGLTILQKKLNS